MSFPVVRRNRGTLVAAKLPIDVGPSITLISKKKDVDTVGDDQYMLYVQVDVLNLESTLRFKHSRNGTRKIQVTDFTANFEMIVESHRTSRKGSVLLELFHKTSDKLHKLAVCVLPVEFRSEKGPKDELECVLRKIPNTNEPEQTPFDSSTNQIVPLVTKPKVAPRRETRKTQAQDSSPFPKPLTARQRRQLQKLDSESEEEEESDFESSSSESESESEMDSEEEVKPTVLPHTLEQTQPQPLQQLPIQHTQPLQQLPIQHIQPLQQIQQQAPVNISYPMYSSYSSEILPQSPHTVLESLPPTAPTSPMSEPLDLNGIEEFLLAPSNPFYLEDESSFNPDNFLNTY